MKKKIIIIFSISVLVSIVLFLVENVFQDAVTIVRRNPSGEGGQVAEYEVEIDGEKEIVQIEIGEREYSEVEIEKVFQEVIEKLDKIVLGDNEHFDRVEKDLHLVTRIENYPVQIQWQLDSYSVMNLYGEIQEKNLVPEGTLVELRGTISYKEKETIYIQHARIYPLTRKGMDKVIYEIEQEVKRLEEDSREEEQFLLPQEINGKSLTWSEKKESRWYYVLLLGVFLSVYLVYREHETIRQAKIDRKEALLRAYPSMISKITMLLSTGTTVRNAWEKIVQNYSETKDALGAQMVYEEMAITLREMQGGVSEAEAYERFGKRCGNTTYVKFGTLLSQNLRKGSKGLSDVMRMESIQAFENRKSTAKRLGEEAGTKLLVPMIGMLAVVFLMVMVPAFLSMQL